MADEIFKVKACDVQDCPTRHDDVVRCTLNLGTGTRTFDLCGAHRRPLEELLELIPRGRGRGKTRGIAGKVVRPEDIPRVMTPIHGQRRLQPEGRSESSETPKKTAAPTKKATPRKAGGPKASRTTKKTPGR